MLLSMSVVEHYHSSQTRLCVSLNLKNTSSELPPVYGVVQYFSSVWGLIAAELLLEATSRDLIRGS